MPTLISFAAGTPILSADVNANFVAVNTEVESALRTGYSSGIAVAYAGPGEQTLHTWTMPAGTLANSGDGIEVYASGSCASNANAKTVKFYLGASGAYTLNPVVTASNDTSFLIHILAIYTGTGSTWQMARRMEFSTGSVEFNGNDAMLAGAPSSARVIALTGTGSAANDIRMYSATIRTFKAP